MSNVAPRHVHLDEPVTLFLLQLNQFPVFAIFRNMTSMHRRTVRLGNYLATEIIIRY